MINKTTKRLLAASRLGINFGYGDRHRYIIFHDCDYEPIRSILPLIERKFYESIKVYGNIIDALNTVDWMLSEIGQPTLESQFDDFQDWGFNDEFVNDNIGWEESGTETPMDWQHLKIKN